MCEHYARYFDAKELSRSFSNLSFSTTGKSLLLSSEGPDSKPHSDSLTPGSLTSRSMTPVTGGTQVVSGGALVPVIIAGSASSGSLRRDLLSGANRTQEESNGARLKLTAMAWGIIPIGMQGRIKPVLNARLETVNQLPTFKPLLRTNRCIIPASGYFDGPNGFSAKNGRFVNHPDKSILAFAGLWDENTCLVAGQKRRVTVITRPADEQPVSYHSRMPLILTSEAAMVWLNPNSTFAELQQAVTNGRLTGLSSSSLNNRSPFQTDFVDQNGTLRRDGDATMPRAA